MDEITVAEIGEIGSSGWFDIVDTKKNEWGSTEKSWAGRTFPEEGATITGRIVEGKEGRMFFFGDDSQGSGGSGGGSHRSGGSSGGGGRGYTGPKKAAGASTGKWQPPTMEQEKLKFVSFSTSYSKDLVVALIAAGILDKSEDIGNALKYFAHQIHQTMIEIADSQE